MNELCEKFPTELAVLAFPCNQFGHQENATNQEIPNLLRAVRPGGGFQFKGDLFEKVDVNGSGEHPIFKHLKAALPLPQDEPEALMSDSRLVLWSPLKRSDIAWNFEKFLVGADGRPVKRYSSSFPTNKIEADIRALL